MQKTTKKWLALILVGALVLGLALTSCTPVAMPAVEATEEPVAAAPAETTEEATEAPAEATEAPAAEASADEGDFTFSLTTLTGETIDDSIVKNNKLTMVNYWATWCGPCVSEIPDLQTISENYADKGVSIIGVLTGDDDYDGARTFLSDTGVTYPVVLPEGVFLDMGSDIYAIPTTIFLDSNGNQVGDTVVGSKSYDDWAGLIDLLLGQVS